MLIVPRRVALVFLLVLAACHDDERAGTPDANADADTGDLDASDLDASDLDASDLDASETDASHHLDASDQDASETDASDFDASDTDANGPFCRDAIPLRCGDRLSHSTSIQGDADLWPSYACTARAEPAPEVVYALEAEARCQVGVRLSELEADIDLFLVDDCERSCSKVSSTPLDLQALETIAFNAESGRAYNVVVDGYDEEGGSYDLAVDCLCGEGDYEFSEGDWLLNVERRWTGDSPDEPSAPLREEDYEAITDGASYRARVWYGWREVSVGEMSWPGVLSASRDGTLSYEITGGSTGAGGRLIIWVGPSGLQAELTHYGSGVPIVSSERGALVRAH
jgi:hypothetical protein